MLIGGKTIVISDDIFLITNIRKNVQEDSSYFEALINKMISLNSLVTNGYCTFGFRKILFFISVRFYSEVGRFWAVHAS